MKILLVEDETMLADNIQHYLLQEGNVCEIASDFTQASEKIELYEYDCVVVDITLPDGSGLDVIRLLKQANLSSGVVIISAKDSLEDKLEGLQIGADDYLTKPFHLPELNARIKSVLRRRNFEGKNEIQFQDINIDTDSQVVTVNLQPVTLTKKEYQLLLYFITNAKRVISKNALAEHLWGDFMDMADSYDFIYSQIKNLKKKLNEHSDHKYIHAVYGMGYKFVKQ
ncbi:response regulator transcription factor [Roseivirga echinicomitans]|uniref:Two-component system response regulator n=1 Tax=Roseivirga echinicomitans TaxID=296218 RepID=A0A150XPY4_9BACT|nr:response regulator transcription factor [Roseivirga echinicomitans]KYG80786.1 two-component system response regulator [Roseivirga echinicomitans]